MTFEELARALEVEGFQESPSELHGMLCGRVAGRERLALEQLRGALVDSLDSEEELIDNTLTTLDKLYRGIIATLENNELSFKPLLPPDTAVLEERVLALSEWCQCFLSGLGDSGLPKRSRPSEEVMDAIKDLAAIAQAGFEGEPEEDDEADLFELEEYVRMAALMIFAELNRDVLAAQSPTLH
jgi:uncharacterized protein YgfB (UPF0149 family)